MLGIVVWEFGGGAAGSSEHYVYVVDAASTKTPDKPVLSATNCDPTISWLDSHTLQINYQSDCTIRQFQNKWFSASDIQNAHHASVEIILNRLAG
jgi:hypothetical protein